jgi:hypothetical protein
MTDYDPKHFELLQGGIFAGLLCRKPYPAWQSIENRAKGLQSRSLSQKKIDLVEKPSSRGFVLQKKVIPPGKRDKTSTWDRSRHFTARIDRSH